MSEYWEDYKAGMLEEIREADDPNGRAIELAATAFWDIHMAWRPEYRRDLSRAWHEILKEVRDDHDDSDKP
jgi:hypothetical protein